MSDQPILIERHEPVGIVTINRPKVLNALNKALMAELKAAFEDSRDDSAVRGVILTEAGDRAFAAGADISELANDTAVEAEEKSRIGQAVTSLIENLGKPVIAAVKSCASRDAERPSVRVSFRQPIGCWVYSPVAGNLAVTGRKVTLCYLDLGITNSGLLAAARLYLQVDPFEAGS